MPVYRFRSVEDMPGEMWRTPGDPELYRALARLWTASRRMRPRRFPPGVTKHRSIAEMNRQRDDWDREYVASLRRPGKEPGSVLRKS
jgi:hypothetical protein